MDCDLWVRNANIPDGDRLVLANLLITGGTFAGITDPGIRVEARNVLDLGGAMALPGCIDSHVHFMDPGFTHRETFATGTAAAAAGGLTTVVDMPCCSVPSVRDCASMENKLAAISPEAHVDFGLWGGATGEDVREGRLGHVQAQAEAGVIGFKAYMTPSVPTYPRSDDAELLEIFLAVAKTGLPVGIHAENFSLCDFNVRKLQRQGRTDGPAWAEARLAMAEKVAIEMCINFAEHTGARAHIVHMSTGAGALAIEAAKRRGLPVTAETCPHYLLLNARESMAEWGSFAKIAPPLRTPEDNAVLWEKLACGAVDFIATDHAPYAIDTEKAAPGMGIWDSFPGIPGVETMVPLLVSEGYNKGRLSLSRLVEVLSGRAARQYGLFPRKGSLSVGADADLTVIDPGCEWIIDKDAMVGKSHYSPFHGFRLKGKVIQTIVRGRVVYADGQLLSKPGYGQFIKRQAW
jgi:allantoinase